MNFWDEDECNQYVGTDSSIFPSFMTTEEGAYKVINNISQQFISLNFMYFPYLGIWAYEPSVCRSLGATYHSKTKYNGIPVYRYEMDIGEGKLETK